MSDPEVLLRRAIELSRRSARGGDEPFGSLLAAADGTVLAEEHNTVASTGDITAHPELKLARWAARELDADTAAATTMYTSCQPCQMCVGAIERAGLGAVVFALSSDQLAEIRVAAVREVVYRGPFLADEARAVMEGR